MVSMASKKRERKKETTTHGHCRHASEASLGLLLLSQWSGYVCSWRRKSKSVKKRERESKGRVGEEREKKSKNEEFSLRSEFFFR